MRANNWITIEQMKSVPAGSIVVSRAIRPGRPTCYTVSDHYTPFKPEEIPELEEFLETQPDLEIHFLVLDEAPNETC
jgi:hypothetical protein